MKAGDFVQTPLGKGIVREVRNRGRVLVEIRGRATEVLGSQITPLNPAGRRSARRRDQQERAPESSWPCGIRPSRGGSARLHRSRSARAR